MDPENNDIILNMFLEDKFKVNGKSSKNRWKITNDAFTKLIKASTLNDIKSILNKLNITVSDLYFSDNPVNFISFQFMRTAFIIKKDDNLEYRITIDVDFKYYLKNDEVCIDNSLTILEIKSTAPLEILELDTDIELFKTKFSKYSYFRNLINIQTKQPSSLIQYDGFEDEIKILVTNHQNYYTELINALDENGFIFKKAKNKHYNDIYFDTDDDFLCKNNYTYRIRNYISSAENILNFKTPSSLETNSYLERSEYKCILPNNEEQFDDIFSINCKINQLLKTILIEHNHDLNLHKRFIIETRREAFRLFDKFKWMADGTEYGLGMLTIDHGEIIMGEKIVKIPIHIEIEFLMSFDSNHNWHDESLQHIARLNEATKTLSQKGINTTKTSKYIIASKLLKGEIYEI
jgi:hypothetical protein